MRTCAALAHDMGLSVSAHSKRSGMAARMAVLFVYAVGMAFVEAAVVVYLRQLYPAIVLPEIPFSSLVYRTELFREAATIVMLVAVAWLAFPRLRSKVLAFLWTFAAWDLFYYVFLKAIIGWPPSLATIDVLFLIPVPWVAPVWFPVAISTVVLIVSGWLLLREVP